MTGTPKMTFWDHLDELRRILMHVVAVLALLFIVFFACMPYLFDKVILGPAQNDFPTYRLMRKVVAEISPQSGFLAQSFDVNLVNIQLGTPFFLHLSTSFWLALVCAVPFILWKVWSFVSPALYPKERKSARSAFLLGSFFFYIGAALGYFMIFPLALNFLVNYELSTLVPNQITLTSYMDNFLMLILLMGLAFQLPLLLTILHHLGILTRKMLTSHRRHAIVALMVVAAVITPTGDPFTMTIVALPLYMLYECSIFMMKKEVADRRG